jgi:hypothetical protein
MTSQQWFSVNNAWQPLGFKDAEALRRWIRKGKDEGWLKLQHHIKPQYPKAKRVTWLVHVERCQFLGSKAAG